MVKPWTDPVADMQCGHARPMLPGERGWEGFGFCFVCPRSKMGEVPIPDLEWVHTQWWLFQW